jgi:glucose/arabinose dehydrogenase
MQATPPGPGQLLQYDSPEGRVIADGLESPTGIAVDPATGDVFIAEQTAGRISRVSAR